MPSIRRVAGWYRALAGICLNLVVAFIALNLVLGLYFWIKDSGQSSADPLTPEFGEDLMRRVYAPLDDGQRSRLLRETWSRVIPNEAFTGFGEAPYSGEYVNVSEHGFRASVPQGPWPSVPSDLNVFLFGGSTAFGYGVADGDTLASALGRELVRRTGPSNRAFVYNFGRNFYFSTQERILFEELLSQGHVPDVAVFLDGINDFNCYRGLPAHFEEQEARLKAALEDGAGAHLLRFLRGLPIGRAATGLAARMGIGRSGASLANAVRARAIGSADSVIDRYVANKRLIEAAGASFGVVTVFVWQPIPTYLYDLSFHPFAGTDLQDRVPATDGYPRMAKFVAARRMGRNFLWCADMQRDLREALYVDRYHYSGRMSSMLGSEICRLMVDGGLVPKEKLPR